MLDENTEIGLNALRDNNLLPMRLNLTVLNIEETFSNAIDAGCTVIQPITEIPEFDVSKAVFVDPDGYQWLLHQVHKHVSFEERSALWKEKLKDD